MVAIKRGRKDAYAHRLSTEFRTEVEMLSQVCLSETPFWKNQIEANPKHDHVSCSAMTSSGTIFCQDVEVLAFQLCSSCYLVQFFRDMLSKLTFQVDHLNLVKLIGYLEEGSERILIVEFVPNGNLGEHIDGTYGKPLDISTRLDIAIDIAHALTYLHLYADRPIIHRDIKSSNILLTDKYRAKVADFGFSRVGPSTDAGATHVSTQVKGTAGQ
jgi:serine/threonine protein kinase